MATKLKSSKILRFISVVILTVSLILLAFMGIYILKNYDSVKSQNFYETNKFKNPFNDLNYAVVDSFTIYKSEEEVKDIEKAKKDILKTEEEIRKDMLDVRIEEYNNRLNVINRYPNIKYIIEDTSEDRLNTNIENDLSEETITNLKNDSDFYLILNIENKKNVLESADSNFTKEQLKNIINNDSFNYRNTENKNLKISYFVPKSFIYEDEISLGKENYNKLKSKALVEKAILLSAVLVTLSILALIYLNIQRKDKNKDKGILERIYSRIYIEFQLVILCIGLVSIIITAYESLRQPEYTVFLGIAMIGTYYLMAFTYGSIIEVKELGIKELLRRKSLIYKMINGLNKIVKSAVEEVFLIKSTGIKISIFLILSFMFMISMLSLRGSSDFITLILVIYILTYIISVISYVVKSANYLNKIVVGSFKIANGDLNYVIDEGGKGILKELSHNINNMKSGLKDSIDSEIKSERMKTELITNVSHDLKTPLTSIITYVDLIKNEDLTKEERMDYIKVLERKSERLKILIEDLFEASKAASGEVDLNIEKVDITSLLKQALAEFEEKIKESSLDFKINLPKEKLYIMVDGKKTWRILENQISNALKYSLENTRVYINIEDIDNKVVITIKNISAFEIDFNEDEILERFKRGDKSRNTEGSGLGLAISNNLTKLQGGDFRVSVDGDLFKVIIEFPKI
ncbi:HAMP domain-containing sensor histidine kinase [Clostridium algidicarnis]|uniref:HAMP domain-containing sensor histidine kinase n=1 Tax=Clostridium algidicarnis TaxID=37659 RepID=UPI001C0BBAD6|nr:HAMP domain-containing sensor histidine kinase [Clostridium algidicarnis]MBU3202905.1 HAMP domain-containing histidine kinase [Clostridium algidicarnis]MBU3211059.1 HAMP domain-containing histidine kinase [Clostridium algidicarnis]MBU3222433.1 HAMP domain-containing histidine kinase [Clostridium algidicarnis]